MSTSTSNAIAQMKAWRQSLTVNGSFSGPMGIRDNALDRLRDRYGFKVATRREAAKFIASRASVHIGDVDVTDVVRDVVVHGGTYPKGIA